MSRKRGVWNTNKQGSASTIPYDASTSGKYKKQIFSGVFFLTLSNVLTKLCGLFLKIPLTNALGDTGMAYFNLAYTVYKWFYMISTAGLPVAVAVLAASFLSDSRDPPSVRGANVRRLRNLALLLFAGMGIVGTALMWYGAPLFAALQGAPLGADAIAAVAPALFFICIASALRGWYQGLNRLLPAAVSQVAEALVKTAGGLLLVSWALSRGMPVHKAAAAVIFGLTAGSFLGMAVMGAALPRITGQTVGMRGGCPSVCRRSTCRRLWAIALPVTLSASVLSLTDMLDSMLVLRRLAASGMEVGEALSLYGNYTSLAVPMFNLPSILIYPITTALTPVIAAADRVEGDSGKVKRDRLIRGSISLVSLIALPSAAGMCAMSGELLALLFRGDLAGRGAPLLALLSPAVFFLGLLAVTNTVLQSVGGAGHTLYGMVAGAVVKLVSGWILCGLPSVGIYGCPIGTVLCYMTMALFNVCVLVRRYGVSLSFVSLCAKPALCAVLCALTGRGVSMWLCGVVGSRMGTLGGIFAAVAVYGVSVLATGAAEPAMSALPPSISRRKA